MKKNTVVWVGLSSALFVALVAIGTFFDLSLSRVLYYKGSVFGRFFLPFGYAPTYLLVALSTLVIFRAVSDQNRFVKWLRPLGGVLFFLSCYLLSWWFADAFFPADNVNYLYAAVFAAGLFFVGLFATRKIERSYFTRLVLVVTVFLISTILVQGIVDLLKYLWSRQAYATLAAANGQPGTDGYTPWYIPNLRQNNADYLVYDGEKQAFFYRAFPSGTVASFASLLSLTLIPELFSGAKRYLGYFYALPVALVVLCGFAEIVAGHAYLTDVTFGAFLGIGGTALTKYLLKKIWIKKRFAGYEAFGGEEE